jgi:hypothetical protein
MKLHRTLSIKYGARRENGHTLHEPDSPIDSSNRELSFIHRGLSNVTKTQRRVERIWCWAGECHWWWEGECDVEEEDLYAIPLRLSITPLGRASGARGNRP